MTEDEMAGWHHWLNGHGFGWTPGVGDGQGGLECCGSWGRKESDMTERLNYNLFFTLNKFTYIQFIPQSLSFYQPFINRKILTLFTARNINCKTHIDKIH